MKRKFYIAYGSNLNLRQMAQRCPTARPLGTAQLKDHILVFRGARSGAVATIEPCPGGQVPVLLWGIGVADEAALDRYEGYPAFYRKETMTVIFKTKDVRAMAYVMNSGHQLGLPGSFYYNTILEGYQDAGFDPDILRDAVEYSREGI